MLCTLVSEAIVTDTKVSFDDIVGLEQAKELLIESIIIPIQHPQLFTGEICISQLIV
jgi:SpoVK/Ycf46/Vps4 family AAA+-type ATPase